MRVLSVIVLLLFATVGICSGMTRPPQPPSKEEILKSEDAKRRERAVVLQEQIGGALAVPVYVFIAVTLLGGLVVEQTRSYVVRQFRMTPSEISDVAIKTYLSLNGLILLILLFSENLHKVAIPLLSLMVATVYPFIVTLLPAIEAGDKGQIKVALNQIKSLYMVIFVLYIIMRVLSPDGLGPLQPR